jgi:hypothetical protein
VAKEATLAKHKYRKIWTDMVMAGVLSGDGGSPRA